MAKRPCIICNISFDFVQWQKMVRCKQSKSLTSNQDSMDPIDQQKKLHKMPLRIAIQKTHSHQKQWRSQTRAHTGLGPGVSNAQVLRRRVSTATRLCTVALRQYCQCAPGCSRVYCSFPDTILSGNEDYVRILGSLVLSPWSALRGGECMHLVWCM